VAEQVRVTAIQAVGALAALRPARRPALERLLGDDRPAVRRAVAEVLAGAPGAEPYLESALVKDGDAGVAGAAAAALCRDVPPTAGKSAAEARAARLSPQARDRLRALALNETIALADRFDLAACLRVQPTPADQKVLDDLARKPPDSLRRRARSLGGR
jgi:hypothetical protein